MIHDLIRNRYNQMKTSQSGQVKYIGPSYLYNMLQVIINIGRISGI